MRIVTTTFAIGCLAGLLATSASAACLESEQPVAGELQSAPYRTSSGKRLDGFVLAMPRPVCVQATDLDGVPTQIEKVRDIQVMASEQAGEQSLARLIGKRITVLGHFDVPDPERQSGDAVLSNAELISVEGEGNEAGGSDNGDQASGMDTSASSGYGSQPGGEESGGTYSGEGTQSGEGSEDSGGYASGGSASETSGSGSYAGNENSPQDQSEEQYSGTGQAGGTAMATTTLRGKTFQQRQRTAGETEIENRIVDFVDRYYLGSGDMTLDDMRAIYASRVSYYGQRGTSLAAVIKDKVAYDKRWPTRRFELVPGTMEIRRTGWDGQVYDISYVYDFAVSAPGRAKSGRGYTRLTIDLAQEGGKVVREAGKVIMRD